MGYTYKKDKISVNSNANAYLMLIQEIDYNRNRRTRRISPVLVYKGIITQGNIILMLFRDNAIML